MFKLIVLSFILNFKIIYHNQNQLKRGLNENTNKCLDKYNSNKSIKSFDEIYCKYDADSKVINEFIVIREGELSNLEDLYDYLAENIMANHTDFNGELLKIISKIWLDFCNENNHSEYNLCNDWKKIFNKNNIYSEHDRNKINKILDDFILELNIYDLKNTLIKELKDLFENKPNSQLKYKDKNKQDLKNFIKLIDKNLIESLNLINYIIFDKKDKWNFYVRVLWNSISIIESELYYTYFLYNDIHILDESKIKSYKKQGFKYIYDEFRVKECFDYNKYFIKTDNFIKLFFDEIEICSYENKNLTMFYSSNDFNNDKNKKNSIFMKITEKDDFESEFNFENNILTRVYPYINKKYAVFNYNKGELELLNVYSDNNKPKTYKIREEMVNLK